MTDASPTQKLKVFISYSRRDASDFAEELVAGLELGGFAPFLDRHDIAAGEDWEARLGGLIRQADTVVFVVTPEAVKSDRCRWEVDTAFARSKRLIPVIFKAVPESAIPEQLRARQFIRFDKGPGITKPLKELAEALRQDIDWIREHTRLGEVADRWETRGHPESLLLRGEELAGAQSWVQRRRADAPVITDAMRAFILASKEAESVGLARVTATQRRIIRMQALTSALLAGIVIGLIGWINQTYLLDSWRSVWIIRPYMRTQVQPYVLSADGERSLKPKDSFKECAKDCPEMIVIPAGKFLMGASPDEIGYYRDQGPRHEVVITKAFAVSKFAITFDEWDACAALRGCDLGITDSGWGRGRQPVIQVTWGDARRYAQWFSDMTGKSYRLLSEAEWEYAARAGTQTAYYWGDQIGKENANCDGCGSRWDGEQAAPVGSFAPNQFGLYDMSGNVGQWVDDCYHSDYQGAPQDGLAWIEDDCPRRVSRGGSWYDSPKLIASSVRWVEHTANRHYVLGFRVARTLGPLNVR
jgi:formylglycine-generating enzyme required for sulfatase activity